MGKLVKLESYSTAYQKEVEEILTDFKELEQYFFDRSLDLLMKSKWKKWSEDQPIGTIFNFSEKEMLEAEDEVVNAMLAIRDTIREKRMKIEEGV